MSNWLANAFRGTGRSSRGHAPLPSTQESQDETLDAAFGGSDDEDDAPELSRDDVRIEMDRLQQRGRSADGEGPDRGPVRPGSPAPAYDSSLSDPIDDLRHMHDSIQPNWRGRLTSVVRYGRVATSEPEGEVVTHPRGTHQTIGSGVGNDGVFANLVAKPEAPRRGPGLEIVGGEDGGEKETPPSYDVAAADAAPPYWETTIIAPQGYLGPDSILVDGLPVGNLFGFAWNLLVSMSFQFVGFLLTYLLHTSHAAKNGSRAGLGITLMQWAFYMRQRAQQLQGELEGVDIVPSTDDEQQQKNAEAAWQALWGAQPSEDVTGDGLAANLTEVIDAAVQNSTDATPTLHGNLPAVQQVMRVSSVANVYLSYVLLALGSALIVGALLNYWKAIRFAASVRRSGGGGDAMDNGITSSRSFVVPF